MSAFTSVSIDAGQAWNAQDYAIDAGFVPVLGSAIARLLDARRGERILDLGCGDGVLSTELALTGAQVIGVDASPELVIAARARGVDAQVMDGHALSFDGEFDAVFSNAALHWMREPDRVLAGVRRALKPGGRLVFCTCSLLPEENEAQVAAFLAAHPDFHVLPLRDIAPPGSAAERLLKRGDAAVAPAGRAEFNVVVRYPAGATTAKAVPTVLIRANGKLATLAPTAVEFGK